MRDCAHAFGISIDDLFADTGTCLRAAAASYERAPIRQLADQPVLAPVHDTIADGQAEVSARASR